MVIDELNKDNKYKMIELLIEEQDGSVWIPAMATDLRIFNKLDELVRVRRIRVRDLGEENVVRISGKVETRNVYLNNKKLSPKKSLKIYSHSPDGFMWGYSGSGPAQLALAVLLELFGEEIAVRNYQKFKSEQIAALDKDRDFEIVIDLTKYSK